MAVKWTIIRTVGQSWGSASHQMPMVHKLKQNALRFWIQCITGIDNSEKWQIENRVFQQTSQERETALTSQYLTLFFSLFSISVVLSICPVVLLSCCRVSLSIFPVVLLSHWPFVPLTLFPLSLSPIVPFPLSRCLVVPSACCPVVLQSSCPILLLSHCPVVLLSRHPAVLLSCCPDSPLSCSAVFL